MREVDIDKLEPHDKNQEIYNDRDNDKLTERIKENGFLDSQNIVATYENVILSGHRRWKAAKKAGLNEVPVEYVDVEPDSDEALLILLSSNDHREKTPGEKINEAEQWEKIEKKKAKERNKKTAGEDPSSPNLDDTDKGKTDEKVAEKVGISKNTYRKGKKVKEKAEQGDEKAQEQWDKLERGETSFHRASKEIEKEEAEKEVEKQKEAEQKYETLIYKMDCEDFLEKVEPADLLLTDPPYSTDVENINSFVDKWLPPALEKTERAFITIGSYSKELNCYLSKLSELGYIDRTQMMVWTYRNTLGQTPNKQYKRNWQAILFIQSDPPIDIDSPKTSEQWGVQDINAPDGRFGERHHKWEKPKKLFDRFIRHTTDEDDLIIDPFAGTGTSLVCGSDLGRKVLGGEKSDEMINIATERGCVIGERMEV